MAKTVAIVDDNKYAIDLLTKFFKEEMQFEVVGFGFDGNAGLDLYRKYKPDLITIDIVMPNKEGVTVIEEIIKEFPEARILIISGSQGDILIECMQAGAIDVIKKPLAFHDRVFREAFKDIVTRIFT